MHSLLESAKGLATNKDESRAMEIAESVFEQQNALMQRVRALKGPISDFEKIGKLMYALRTKFDVLGDQRAIEDETSAGSRSGSAGRSKIAGRCDPQATQIADSDWNRHRNSVDDLHSVHVLEGYHSASVGAGGECEDHSVPRCSHKNGA